MGAIAWSWTCNRTRKAGLLWFEDTQEEGTQEGTQEEGTQEGDTEEETQEEGTQEDVQEEDRQEDTQEGYTRQAIWMQRSEGENEQQTGHLGWVSGDAAHLRVVGGVRFDHLFSCEIVPGRDLLAFQ